MHSSYRGRFAPSPSGPLHFGSLVAALGSWADARQHDGEWLVRIEDLDPPRVRPGAADHILRTLERFGLYWDGEVTYQSTRRPAYEAALEELAGIGRIYPCTCSRKEIQAAAHPGIEGPVYPGTCRSGPKGTRKHAALRLRTDNDAVAFGDRRQGNLEQRLERDVGDFIVRRADDLFAYQLAVVVDDAAQAITHIVRGTDLLHSTPRQILLQQLLGLPTPSYLHLPLAMGSDGRKLSKQDAARPVDDNNPLPTLRAAWRFLGQTAPQSTCGSVEEFCQFARHNWQAWRVPVNQ